MSDELTCQHVHEDGSPCGAPAQFVDPETGLCHAHGPGAEKRMAERGRKGAESANRKRREGKGLAVDELPPLTSHEVAEWWLDVVGRAVGEGRLSAAEANAIRGCVRDWITARESGKVSDRVRRLEAALAEARETGDVSAVLEVVKGDKAS